MFCVPLANTDSSPSLPHLPTSIDFSLHGPAIAEGIVTDLREVFSAALQSHQRTVPDSDGDGEGGGEEEEEEGGEREEGGKREGGAIGILRPCIQCLQLLTRSQGGLREELSSEGDFLLDTFRG